MNTKEYDIIYEPVEEHKNILVNIDKFYTDKFILNKMLYVLFNNVDYIIYKQGLRSKFSHNYYYYVVSTVIIVITRCCD